MNNMRSIDADKHLQDFDPEWEQLLFTCHIYGAVAGINWTRHVSDDFFSYLYFKLRVIEKSRNSDVLIGLFFDLHIWGGPQGEQGDELRAYLKNADKGLKDETTAWLYGWIEGLRLSKENPERANEVLHMANTTVR